MPLYEYRCQSCGHVFEELRRMSDADREGECPRCHAKAPARLFSAFATGGCGAGSGNRFR